MAEVLDIIVRQRGARRVAKDIATIGVAATLTSTNLKKLKITLNHTGTAFGTTAVTATQFNKKLMTTGTAGAVAAGGVNTIKASLLGLGAAATLAGGALVSGFLRPLVGAVSAAGDFEAAMNLTAVLATVDRGTDAFQAMQDTARQLGITTKFSAVEAAEGMAFLAKTGLDAAETIAAIPETLKIAAAAELGLGRASDIVTNILNGFRLTLEELPRAVDILATTFTSSNVDIEQLAQSFQAVGPIAAQLGQRFEDVAAVVGKLGDSGIQAEKAGVALRRIFINLQTDANKTNSILRKFGINIRNSEGQFRPLIKIFNDIAAAGVGPAQSIDLFGARALAAAGIIRNSEAELQGFADNMNQVGRAGDIAEKRLVGFNGEMTRLKSAIEGFKIALSNSGFLDFATKALAVLTELARAAARLPKPILQIIGGFAAIAGTIGAILVPLGLITFAFAVIGPLVAGITFGSVIAGLGSFLLVAVPVAGAVTALIASFVSFKDEEFQLGNTTVTMSSLVVESLATIISAFKDLPFQFWLSANLLVDSFNDFLDSTETFGKETDENLPTFKNFLLSVISAVSAADSIFTEFSNRVGHTFEGILKSMGSMFSLLPDVISAQLDDDPNTSAATVLANAFKTDFLHEFDGFGARIGIIMNEEMADAERLLEFFGGTDVVKRAGKRLENIKGPKKALESDGGRGGKGGGGVDESILTANQEAARLAIDRLIASYTPGKTASLELAAAQKQLSQAFGLGVLKAGEQEIVMRGLRKAMGEDFLASINPVYKALLDRRDVMKSIQALNEEGLITSAQMLESSALAMEQSQQQLLALDEYKKSLTDIQALQLGVVEGLKGWAITGRTTFDLIKGGIMDMGSLIETSLTKALMEGEFSFRAFGLAVVQIIQQMITKLLIQIAMQALLNSLSGFGGGAPGVGALGGGSGGVSAPGGGALAFSGPTRAGGGSVQNGQPFLVGEKGPEIFMPKKTGTIVPNSQIGPALNAAPPPVVNVKVVNVDDPESVVGAMESSEGERLIVNTIMRNRKRIG